MAFILNFYSGLDFMTKAVLGTIAVILVLIIVEILEVNNDQQDIKEIFNPMIFALIITFIFIVMQRLSEVLK